MMGVHMLRQRLSLSKVLVSWKDLLTACKQSVEFAAEWIPGCHTLGLEFLRKD